MLNWEAIGAVGDVVAAIAVIVSLLYLAKQIRIGNDLSRTTTFREIMHGLVQHQNVMFDPQNADLLATGFMGYHDLDGVEKMRFMGLMSNLFQFVEDSWNSAEVGLLGDETMENWRFYLSTHVLPYKGAREWWDAAKLSYAPDLQVWVDELITSVDLSADPYGLKNTEKGDA